MIQSLKFRIKQEQGKLFHTAESQPINIDNRMKWEKSPHGKCQRNSCHRQKSLMNIKISGWKYGEKENTDLITTRYWLITNGKKTIKWRNLADITLTKWTGVMSTLGHSDVMVLLIQHRERHLTLVQEACSRCVTWQNIIRKKQLEGQSTN